MATFGGEPLLLPEGELEALFKIGMEKHNMNLIQTNGTLINETHLQLFKKYQVRVGVSIDGSGELNDLRWAGSLAKTRAATRKTEESIRQLCEQKIPVCLIVTLYKKNAVPEKFSQLIEWLIQMAEIGVAHVRIHVLEATHPSILKRYGLSPKENIYTLLAMAEYECYWGKHFIDIFYDIRRMLIGNDTHVSCVWRGCDIFHTLAVKSIGPFGEGYNCGRILRRLIRTEKLGYERHLALFQTPRKYGGCRGCRFFFACKGQCPAMAIDGDWRNRNEYCEVWESLFTFFERKLLQEGSQPLSLSPQRSQIEKLLMESFSINQVPSLERIIHQVGLKGGCRTNEAT